MINALTNRSKAITNCIKTPAIIQNPFNGKKIETLGIWDTGATNSCITKTLAEQLDLTVIQKTNVSGVHGVQEANVYFVNITLNNQNITVNALVTEAAELSADHRTGLLIGMNIITLGDFCISNHGQTVMTFRTPSLEIVDYVNEISINNQITKVYQIQAKRGIEKCPCKSGRLYKNCCKNSKYNQ